MKHATLLRPGKTNGRAPLVCFPGFLGTPDAFREVATLLRHPGSIFGVGLPGHGRPPRRVIPGGFLAVVEELARDLDERAFLLGYSLGARLALAVASARPERVRGVISVGACFGIVDEAERVRRRAWESAQISLLRLHGLPVFVEYWESLPLFDTQHALAADVLEGQRNARLAHDPDGIAQALANLGTGSMPDLLPGLARARVPLLLCAGSRDPRFIREAERARSVVSHARRQVIDGAGHNAVLEAPQLLASVVDDQLERWSESPRMETRP